MGLKRNKINAMNENLKATYRGKKHTSQAILDRDVFDSAQLPALLKTFALNNWNNQQVNDDGKIEASEIKILDHAYQNAEPNKVLVTVHWEFV